MNIRVIHHHIYHNNGLHPQHIPSENLIVNEIETSVFKNSLITCCTFIDSLSKIEERFASRGYASIAEYYKAIIFRFKQIEEMLSPNDIEHHLNEWNALLTEFDLQHQQFLRLHAIDLTLEDFSERMLKELDNLDQHHAAEIFQEINELTEFMKNKAILKDLAEIENYIQKLDQLIGIGTLKLFARDGEERP